MSLHSAVAIALLVVLVFASAAIADDPPRTLPGSQQVCWSGGFDAHLCCECGYFDCFPGPTGKAVAAHCCAGEGSGESKPASHGVIDWDNATIRVGRSRVCRADDAKACAMDRGRNFKDPSCGILADYVGGLSPACKMRIAGIPECKEAIAFAGWSYWHHRHHVRHRTTDSTKECLAELYAMRREYNRLRDDQGEPYSGDRPNFFEQGYVAHLRRCKISRTRELVGYFDRARLAFHGDKEDAGVDASARLPVKNDGRRRARIGVVIALAPHEGEFYARTLDMWHCYCEYHGDCDIILETDDYIPLEEYPRMLVWEPATQLHSIKVGKAWNRWFALRKHAQLQGYEWLFTADPDQFPSQECFRSVSLSQALRNAGDRTSVVMRDFAHYHTLNSAGVFFRVGAGSRLFIDLLMERLHWDGFTDFDQSAFDQTVLEFQELFYVSAPHVDKHRVSFSNSFCFARQIQWLDGKALLQHYFSCWHTLMDSWLGQLGSRKIDNAVLLVDPREIDINYVLGGRSKEKAPLIWHLAGRDKFVRGVTGESMLDAQVRMFWNASELPAGTGLRKGTRNCKFWVGAARRSKCQPGTELLDCRHGWLAMC